MLTQTHFEVAVNASYLFMRYFSFGKLFEMKSATRNRMHASARLVITRGKNKGEYYANVFETEIARAKQVGLERKLLYAALIYTGLRKNDLASITASQAVLDHEIPHLLLLAKDSKTDEEAAIPICNALLEPLKKCLAQRKLDGSLKPTDKLFRIPDGLLKILERDLHAAGNWTSLPRA